MKTNDKLLPCPFCGSRDLRIDEGIYKDHVNNGYFVACNNIYCEAEGPWDLGKSGAIEKWNERAVINEN